MSSMARRRQRLFTLPVIKGSDSHVSSKPHLASSSRADADEDWHHLSGSSTAADLFQRPTQVRSKWQAVEGAISHIERSDTEVDAWQKSYSKNSRRRRHTGAMPPGIPLDTSVSITSFGTEASIATDVYESADRKSYLSSNRQASSKAGVADSSIARDASSHARRSWVVKRNSRPSIGVPKAKRAIYLGGGWSTYTERADLCKIPRFVFIM